MGRLIVALSLVAAACGGATTAATGPPQPTTTPAAAPVTSEVEADMADADVVAEPVTPLESAEAPDPSVEPPEPVVTRTRPEGPDAPDFVLALGQGGEFSLSGEQRPVYMIFWAEW